MDGRPVVWARVIAALLMLALLGGPAITLAGADTAVAPATPAAPGFQITNDTYLHEQWALFNWGQIVGGVNHARAGVDIRAPEAWARTMGSPDVVVAVIDSGIAYDHPDLAPNVWSNPGEMGDGKDANGKDDDGNGYIDDWRGWDFADGDNDPRDVRAGSILNPTGDIAHGTAVASVIAAAGNNGLGMTGVAPRARIMALRAPVGDDGKIASAIRYAQLMGARIVNMSFGTYIPGTANPAIAQAIHAAPELLFVAAAGNSANDADILRTQPCGIAQPNIICVAATDEQDQLASFGSGGTNIGRKSVDLGAPGDDILVAQPAVATIYQEGFEAGLGER